MAKLDRFFQALYECGAQELQLVSGRSPAFKFRDGLRPASSVQPSVAQLIGLLEEILDAQLVAQLRASGQAQATVNRPGLAPMAFRAEASSSSLEAIFVPGAPSASKACPPAEPATRPETPPETPVGTGAQPRPETLPGTKLETGAQPKSAPLPGTKLETGAAPRPASLGETGLVAEAEPGAAAVPHAAAAIVTGNSAPMDDYFRQMVAAGASDIHLSAGQAPLLRVDGEIVPMEGRTPLTPEDVWQLLEPITPEKNRAEFLETHDTDFAYEIEGLARFRANIFRDRFGAGAVFRTIPSEILTAEDLNLSSAILELCTLHRGLVLVTGPTGSGKSTTLTAMIDHINKTRQDHIITIEDPIEFVHQNNKCLVNQREVGTHTASFKRALRAALREDPDIVLVGELRDLETIAIAIETAETGHLVFGTLHTTTAVSTVDRIIDQFPPKQQAQVRTMLSESLRGVIAQNLCKKIGGGRIAALEVLIGIPSVANLIREGKTFQIPSIMQTGKRHGMVTLNEALVDLVKAEKISSEEAWRRAADKTMAAAALKSAGCDMSFLEGPAKLTPA